MLFNAIKGKGFTLTLPAGSSIVRAVGADWSKEDVVGRLKYGQ